MFQRLIANIADIVIILPAILIYINRQYLAKELKVLSIYVLITFLRNLIGLIYNFLLVRYEYQANTVFYYNVHNIIGFYLIAYLYFILLKSIFWRNIILGLTAFFSFFTTLDVINGTLGINTPEFNKYSTLFRVSLLHFWHLHIFIRF